MAIAQAIEAQHLQPGDVLTGSLETVKWIWRTGLKIPRAKCELLLESADGAERVDQWDKSTKVEVVR